MLSFPALFLVLADLMDPMFRFPGVCNIFPWFC